jgi:DNA-binding transcriptional MerR regulator
MAPPETYTTGQLAEAANVGPQTLRYYERRGLLPEPPRTSGGHRIYGAAHLERVLFIQNAQALGFELREIQGMLELQGGRIGAEDAMARAADRLLEAIGGKIDALERLRRSVEAIRDGSARAATPYRSHQPAPLQVRPS